MIVLVGVTLTVGLAVLSFVRVSPSGISYRKPETWSNQATLVLTQKGSPELRSVLPAAPGGFNSALADTSRFASLIDVYTTFATSDAVVNELRRRRLVTAAELREGALPITAAAVPSTVNAATPMMTITATSTTGERATRLTLGATKAFLDVLNARQSAAKIPAKDRIQVRIVKSSEAPILVNPRSKALPVLVLLAGLIATLAVAFTRNNLARSERAPALAHVVHRADSERSVGETDPASAPRPIPRPDATTARDGSGRTIGVAGGRSTLGSVPRSDSAGARGQDMPDDVAQQGRRS